MNIVQRLENRSRIDFLHWPEGFEAFAESQSASSGIRIEFAKTDDTLVTVTHGLCGARVAFSLNNPLTNAWRVAAFHSCALYEMSVFDAQNLSKADGIVVEGSHFVAPLAISTADCMAIAMTYERSQRIELAACFHAGWRGYVGGIQQEILTWFKNKLRENDLLDDGWQENLHITVGPAIAGYHYPCGSDVEVAMNEHLCTRLRPLANWTPDHERAFDASLGANAASAEVAIPKIHPDLQALVTIEFSALGIPIDNIKVFREDTFTSTWWPSHRRAMGQGLPHAGRFFTHLCPPTCSEVLNHGSKS